MTREEAITEMYAVMKDMACLPKKQQLPEPAKGEDACLLVLSLHGGHALPGEMAKEAGVSGARMAATLRQLESKGYITRETDPDDRRKVQVSMTESGWEAARKEQQFVHDKMGEVYDILGEDDMEALIRIMKKMHSYALEDRSCLGAQSE